MLNVGLIGLGAEWDDAFRPALAALSRRLRVRCLYTPVATRAEQAAAELGCEVAGGMFALLERDDVRAVLVLDGAWYAGVPAQLACHLGKPAFIAAPLGLRLPIADSLLRRAAESGVTLMADFRRRYTPATSRLRELMATRLGRPTSIVVNARSPGFVSEDLAPEQVLREVLASVIDWCTSLVGTPPAARAPAVTGERSGTLEMNLDYRRPAASDVAASACIRLDRAIGSRSAAQAREASQGFQAEVRCIQGVATIEGAHLIRWESAGEERSESLEGERAAIQVMLDHFTRRVVGGLIPVPTLEDTCRAFDLADAALLGASAP